MRGRLTDRQKDSLTVRRTDIPTERQKDRRTDRQNDKHINREGREITEGVSLPPYKNKMVVGGGKVTL